MNMIKLTLLFGRKPIYINKDRIIAVYEDKEYDKNDLERHQQECLNEEKRLYSEGRYEDAEHYHNLQDNYFPKYFLYTCVDLGENTYKVCESVDEVIKLLV